jgi:putative ABC transport system substrate-binding protein
MNNTFKSACVFCFFFFFPAALYGSEASAILLINSDDSVEKYRDAGNAFKEALSSIPFQEVLMNDSIREVSDIEKILMTPRFKAVHCIGTKAYLIANQYAGEKHIVFSSVMNWLRLPTTERTFGVSNELPSEMQMMLFRYIFPNIKKIGVLYSSQYNKEWFEAARDAAKKMEVEIIGQALSDEKETLPGLKTLLPLADSFWLISDPVVMSDKTVLFELLKQCDSRKLPVFSYHDAFGRYGAALIVSADNPTIGRQAAGIAADLLSGKNPEGKVLFPAGTHITLNLKKIREYGLPYNENALGSVNNIIE